MKKLLFAFCALALISLVVTTTGCNPTGKQAETDSTATAEVNTKGESKGRKAKTKGEADAAKDSVAAADSIDKDLQALEEQAPARIKDFYIKYVYGGWETNEGALRKYCTKKMVKKLRDSYDYEGEGFAVWDFRAKLDDSDFSVSSFQSVESRGDGVFRAHYKEFGKAGYCDVRMVMEDGKPMIDQIIRNYYPG